MNVTSNERGGNGSPPVREDFDDLNSIEAVGCGAREIDHLLRDVAANETLRPGAIQLDEIRPSTTADLKHALSNYGHGAKEWTEKRVSLAPEEWRVISRNESPIRSLAHLAQNARPVLPAARARVPARSRVDGMTPRALVRRGRYLGHRLLVAPFHSLSARARDPAVAAP